MEFPKGIMAKKPPENAPDFVIAKIAVKSIDFLEYLTEKDKEWVNFEILRSRAGNFYMKFIEWKQNDKRKAKPDNQPDFSEPSEPFIDYEEIPF